MRFAAAVFVALCAFAYPAMGEPVAYSDVLALEASSVTPGTTNGSSGDDASASTLLSAEQAELMAGDPDWRPHVSLYHAGGGGATGNDSLGCRPVAMRTVAVDPRVIPRRTRLFIRETVGMLMPNGARHDGYWYASDTGGAIKGQRVDLYTGNGRGSMRTVQRFNQRTVTVADAGRFDGCPPAWNTAPAATQVASAETGVQMAAN